MTYQGLSSRPASTHAAAVRFVCRLIEWLSQIDGGFAIDCIKLCATRRTAWYSLGGVGRGSDLGAGNAIEFVVILLVRPSR